MTTKHIRCRSCGAADASLRGRCARGRRFAGLSLVPPRDGGWMYHCARCDLLMRHPIQSPAEIVALYEQSPGSHWAASGLRPDQLRAASYVAQQLPNGGSVLDVGCSTGDLLHALGPAVQKFGLEPSEGARALAADRGIRLVGRSVSDLPTLDLKFDVITAIDVIEHVDDPLRFLRNLAANVSPDGCIVISTGNARTLAWRLCGPSYYYSHLYEHISFISDRWCEHVASLGFAVEMIDQNFAHKLPGRARLVPTSKRLLMFVAKLLASRLERATLMQVPGTARRLGPRLMVGEPGLFKDHLLVAFRPTA